MSWIRNVFRRSGSDSHSRGTREHQGVELRRDRSEVFVTGDNPIRHPEDDTLGRALLARSFAQQVLALDSREGVAVGVLGAWGSGKTSFINLARIEFERVGVPTLDFNPWMFSGTEQLVEAFFTELAAQLNVRPEFAEIAKGIEEYGEAFSGLKWLPVLGPWIERGRDVSKILEKMLRRPKEGIGHRRRRLENALADLDRPIVVVLDDIDRLSSSEIRDVFKLVRLTASFPNVLYVVAFDRSRVEKALSEQGVPGRDYLEKILQVAIDLPEVSSDVLHGQIFEAIDRAIVGIENRGPFYYEEWPDVFMEIVRPLVRNMRDVRRYAVGVRGTVKALDGQIPLGDVLALEAIRIFLPDVHSQFHGAIDGLTTVPGSYLSHSDPGHLRGLIDSLVEASGTKQALVRSMITRLFPAAQRHIGGSHYGPSGRSDGYVSVESRTKRFSSCTASALLERGYEHF
jgi:predicted KAP-like P-loop ATPase